MHIRSIRTPDTQPLNTNLQKDDSSDAADNNRHHQHYHNAHVPHLL